MRDMNAKIKAPGLTQQIFIGLVLGIAIGVLWPSFGIALKPLAKLFLLLIKSIIAPLIFSTLVVGIAGAGSLEAIGRMGAKTLIYFEIVTTLALGIGLLAVNIAQPGVGVQISATAGPQSGLDVPPPPSGSDMLLHMFPSSVVDAMARGDVLQIVVFCVLFSMGVVAAGEKARPVLVFCEAVAEVMFKFTGFIMLYAPIGVAASIAATVGEKGLGVLLHLAMLIGTLYVALAVFVLSVLGTVAAIIRLPLGRFLATVREPVLLAYSTASSEAALPLAMERMEKFGVPRRIVSFVMPTGYSFNLDGTTLYLSLALIFVAQAAGVHLTWSQQLLMMMTLLLSSKGVAAVPRASLVILAGTLTSFGLPLEGVAIILGVDTLMDMGRTAVNVLGNCLATVVIARWEGAMPAFGLPAPSPELRTIDLVDSDTVAVHSEQMALEDKDYDLPVVIMQPYHVN
jgi:proton glutamate symport protein